MIFFRQSFTQTLDVHSPRIQAQNTDFDKSLLNGFGERCATRAVQWGVRGGIEARAQRAGDTQFSNTSSRTIRTSRRGPTPVLTSSFGVILRYAFRADVVHQAANMLGTHECHIPPQCAHRW